MAMAARRRTATGLVLGAAVRVAPALLVAAGRAIMGSMRSRRHFTGFPRSGAAGVFTALLALAGCGAPRPPAPGDATEGSGLEQRAAAREQTAKPLPERVPMQEAETPVTGEVPPKILQAIREDLRKRLGIEDPQAPQLVRGQSVTWSDGSLGCPKPGQSYTQALVSGYWVVFEFEGREYDYRASERGYFILCDSPAFASDPLPSKSR